MNNRYIEVYIPEHKRSHINGCVYEHIVIAEGIIGRSLQDKEVVHHIDKNRSNNNPDNLMIFKTSSDHSRYHKTGICVKNKDKTYSSPAQNVCIKCGKIRDFKSKSKMCRDCYNIFERKLKVSSIPQKQDLINMINEKVSFCEIGRIYGVSDNSIRKWCKKYEIPYKKNKK